MTTLDTTSNHAAHRGTGRIVLTVLAVWAGLVAWASSTGVFTSLPMPVFSAIVAALLATAIGVYFASSSLRASAEQLGLQRLTALHAWRILAALVFYHYGAQGLLPPVFVAFAATGDLIAGVLALYVVIAKPRSKTAHAAFHIIGMADFVLAVGTGLTLSLLADGRMETIAQFPLALIPLFGVILSGVTHVAALDLLRRDKGLPR